MQYTKHNGALFYYPLKYWDSAIESYVWLHEEFDDAYNRERRYNEQHKELFDTDRQPHFVMRVYLRDEELNDTAEDRDGGESDE